MSALLLGQPIFPGDNSVDQLVEIIKIFRREVTPEAMDLASRLLQYSPKLRCTALDACAHSLFDYLRGPRACLPNGRALPRLFDFTNQELYGELVPTPQGGRQIDPLI